MPLLPLRTLELPDGARQLRDEWLADLDQRLKNPDGSAHRLNLSPQQEDAIVAFLNALTDVTFISDPKCGNPFAH